MSRPKVIIIGGGFGGLNAAKALKKAPVDIVLLDKSNHHLFQPLLYQVATAVLSAGNIATPIREALAKQNNTSVFLAEISAIDKEKKIVIAANGDTFVYDYLIIAPGATHSYFNHPEWEKFAPGLKTLVDAENIRNTILLSFERAERSETKEEAAKFMRFVIIGGGPTGVEMSGAIAEMAHRSLKNNFRHIKPEESKIYLIEGQNQILPTFSAKLATKALKDLELLGVEVLLNSMMTNISEEGVWIGERFIETPNIIWAAGNKASSLLQSLQTPLDRFQRVIVEADLSIPQHPEIFVIGDAACCKHKNGDPLPGIAPVAIQQGRYVANIIGKQTPAKERAPFAYFDKGTMATIGKNKAIAQVGKIQLSGHIAWFAWCFIHILYLISFSNRVLVLIQWLFLYFSNRRRVRLIMKAVHEEDEPLHTPSTH